MAELQLEREKLEEYRKESERVLLEREEGAKESSRHQMEDYQRNCDETVAARIRELEQVNETAVDEKVALCLFAKIEELKVVNDRELEVSFAKTLAARVAELESANEQVIAEKLAEAVAAKTEEIERNNKTVVEYCIRDQELKFQEDFRFEILKLQDQVESKLAEECAELEVKKAVFKAEIVEEMTLAGKRREGELEALARAQLDELRHTVESLELSLRQREAEAADTELVLTNKEAELERLEDEVKEFEVARQGLVETVEKLVTQIRVLEECVMEGEERIRQLKDVICEREREVEGLKEELNALSVLKPADDVVDSDKVVRSLKQEVARLEAELASSTSEFSASELEWKERLMSLEETVRESESRALELSNRISSVKEERAAVVCKLLEASSERELQLRSCLVSQQALAGELSVKVTVLEATVRGTQATIEKMVEEHCAMDAECRVVRQQLESARTDLEVKSALNESSAKTIVELTDMVETAKVIEAKKRTNIEDVHAQDLARYRNKIGELEGALSALNETSSRTIRELTSIVEAGKILDAKEKTDVEDIQAQDLARYKTTTDELQVALVKSEDTVRSLKEALEKENKKVLRVEEETSECRALIVSLELDLTRCKKSIAELESSVVVHSNKNTFFEAALMEYEAMEVELDERRRASETELSGNDGK